MATSSPPGPDTNLAPPFLIACGVLSAIALCLCVTRIIIRCRPSPHLTTDDYLIAAAGVFSLASFILSAVSAAKGWGHPSYYVSAKDQRTIKICSFVVQFCYNNAIALIRISVACSLMRFSTSRIWRWSLWFLIILHLIISTGWQIVLFFNCRPLRSFWEPVAHPSCWDRNFTLIFGWISAGIFTLMDLTLALLPIKLIRTLNRPLREKILVGCLMAMGLLTTAISGVKMTTFKDVYLGDPLQKAVALTTWAKLEEQVGLIAACMPCLKSSIEKVLRRVGVLSNRNRAITKPSFVISHPDRLNIALSPLTRASTDSVTAVEGVSKNSNVSLVSSSETAWAGRKTDPETV